MTWRMDVCSLGRLEEKTCEGLDFIYVTFGVMVNQVITVPGLPTFLHKEINKQGWRFAIEWGTRWWVDLYLPSLGSWLDLWWLAPIKVSTMPSRALSVTIKKDVVGDYRSYGGAADYPTSRWLAWKTLKMARKWSELQWLCNQLICPWCHD